MRIGIDVRVLQNSQWRGQAQYVYYLVKNLLELDRDNQYILFYNALNKGKFVFELDRANLKQVWCRVPGTFLRFFWHRYGNPVVDSFLGKLDIFHNPLNYSLTHYSPIPTHARMVATFNGFADPETIWKKFNQKMINHWFKSLKRDAWRVIAVSQGAKRELIHLAGVNEDKIRVIYYGVADNFKPASDNGLLQENLAGWGLKDKKYILYVGASEENKNLSRLLEAFSVISKQSRHNDIFLVLTGRIDTSFLDLSKKAEALGIGKRVIFTDFIDHDKLPLLYNGARAFILPSFAESFGIPLIEAMACGTPVLASNIPGLTEIAKDTALFFDPKDSEGIVRVMRDILEYDSLRNSLRDKGLKLAGEFSWEKTAQKTLEVYKELQ
ncbi:MAG: glycosyltransferase family 4 protein [Candidatus Omnitrophica bacterium]|nr:glycosyltransferase family 4 protein [Candidatus Omnitrophota bacterium]